MRNVDAFILAFRRGANAENPLREVHNGNGGTGRSNAWIRGTHGGT
jgi:hypothetical protein